MRRILSMMAAIALLASLSGCSCSRFCCTAGCLFGGGGADCESCGEVGCETCGSADCESCDQAACDTCGSADCESCGQAACDTCGGAGCQSCMRGAIAACGVPGCSGCRGCSQEAFTPGPPAAAITYPYYTSRGPRDFLAENPPSIGP